jgi:hypothetical protein
LDIPGLFELGLLKYGKRGPEAAMKSRLKKIDKIVILDSPPKLF